MPKKSVRIPHDMTVHQLATAMRVSDTEIIKNLFMMGIMRTVHQIVELNLARDLAKNMGYEITVQNNQDEDDDEDDDPGTTAPVPAH